MEAVNSLSDKTISIRDGWELNLMNEYKVLISSEDSPVDLDRLTESGDFIALYLTGEIPEELQDPKTMMRPYQISIKKNENGGIDQTVYALPNKFKRSHQNGTWTPFEKSVMKASMYLSDRFFYSRKPAVANLKYPIFDKFANIGLFGDIRRGFVQEIAKDGMFFGDRISKIQ